MSEPFSGQRFMALYRSVPKFLCLRLLAAPFLLSLIELTVTLYFQPAAYWQGNRFVAVEGNPIARLPLRSLSKAME
jgi:hypothetical protein